MAASAEVVAVAVAADVPLEPQPFVLRLPDELVLEALTHWDVRTLVVNKRVCHNWRQLCTQAIDAKRTNESRRIFQTNKELRRATKQYVGYYDNPDHHADDPLLMSPHSVPLLLNRFGYCDPEHAEELASQYGWPIGKWDVSHVRQLASIFSHLATFNEDITSWDVSNATTLRGMFAKASSFNQDISTWNVSASVTDMAGMFYFATAFHQNLSLWDTSNVIHMEALFTKATSFNGDVSLWNTSNVINMTAMFGYATSFNQDISAWDTCNVTEMKYTFHTAKSFNQDLSSWDTGNVTTMEGMFINATSFRQDLSSWDMRNVPRRARRDLFAGSGNVRRSKRLGGSSSHHHEPDEPCS
jgi:surface protein